MKKYSREWSVAAAFGLLMMSLLIVAPHFFQWQPLLSRVTSQMPAMVVALGVAMVIISRQIDISIGAQFSMCAVIAGLVAASGLPLGVAILAAIAAGALMGALNGLLVAYLGLPSIVVTLATMVTWQEALRLWQQGRLLNLPEGIQWFGQSQESGQAIVIGATALLLILLAWVMKNIAAGRAIYAVGSDAEAARLAGINPQRTTFGVFVSMGVLAALAAVMNLVQSPQIQPSCGDGMELKAIAAAVVGGIAIRGGRGTLWGVLPGLFLLANVNPALTHFHQPPYWEKAIQGLVIILAVVADGWNQKKQSNNG
jgi:rhamnose transport system permease protein